MRKFRAHIIGSFFSFALILPPAAFGFGFFCDRQLATTIVDVEDFKEVREVKMYGEGVVGHTVTWDIPNISVILTSAFYRQAIHIKILEADKLDKFEQPTDPCGKFKLDDIVILKVPLEDTGKYKVGENHAFQFIWDGNTSIGYNFAWKVIESN